MKTLLPIAVLLIAGLLVTSGCQSTAKTSGQPDTADTEELTLVVQGLSCPLCAHNLDKQLLRTSGIVGANVNLSDGTVAVTYRKGQRPTREALDKLVSDAGFTLTDVK